MLLFDSIIRFSGVAFLALLAIMALRDFRKWRGTPYLILSSISLIALFLGYAPAAIRPSGVFYTVLRIIDVPHLVFVWLFTLSLFQAKFGLRGFHILAGVFYCLPIMWLRFTAPAEGPVSSTLKVYLIYWVSFTSLLLMTHLCWSALANFKDDLSDARRKFRIYFVCLILFVTLIAATSEIMIVNVVGFPTYTIKALSIWPAIICGTYWMLGFRSASVSFGMKPSKKNAVASHFDETLSTRLTEEMVNNETYKERGLIITDLAKRLGVSQHNLRAFINQHLGYANFSSFINSYRIKAVKSALADPKSSNDAILTIAIDAGFNSLPSFNRVFKATEGITPTQYREHRRRSLE